MKRAGPGKLLSARNSLDVLSHRSFCAILQNNVLQVSAAAQNSHYINAITKSSEMKLILLKLLKLK